jgi:hypothetical protein
VAFFVPLKNIKPHRHAEFVTFLNYVPYVVNSYAEKMKLGLHTVTLWFGVVMVLLVTTGALAIAFTDVMSDRLYGAKRIGFVILLLAYAVYRSFRIYQVLKYSKNEE